MTMNSTNAIEAAYPILHQRNPSSYIISTTLVVARSGPPLVITYGSENSWKYPIMVMTLTNSIVGPSSGSVTLKKRRTGPAPSIYAAS